MSGPTLLEEKLGALLERFEAIRGEKRDLTREIAQRDQRIRALEEESKRLRAQIDALGKDRFTLKQLRDERKVIRRKLETALNRLRALEEEVRS